MLRVLGIVLLILLVLAGATAGLAYYGYSNLEVEFGEFTGLQPEFSIDADSLREAMEGLTVLEKLSVLRQYLDEVGIEATGELHNSTFVPLYIPPLDHELYVDGELLGGPVHTESMWLGSQETLSVPVEVRMPVAELPPRVIQLVYSGGSIDVTVESAGMVGPFPVSTTSVVSITVANPLAFLGLGGE